MRQRLATKTLVIDFDNGEDRDAVKLNSKHMNRTVRDPIQSKSSSNKHTHTGYSNLHGT
jgi:hypothetical protein